jgi:L-asparaginase/Glu-tRNA(Gln) amidotransferase subunit D
VVITTLDYEDRLDIAEKYKGLSKEELNQIYINKGYNGITGLGWNDLQRFINHNI